MTVQELITELNKVKDKTLKIELIINFHDGWRYDTEYASLSKVKTTDRVVELFGSDIDPDVIREYER